MILFIGVLFCSGCASVPVGRRSVEGVLRRHLVRSSALRVPASEPSPQRKTVESVQLKIPLSRRVRRSSPFGRRRGRPHRGVDLHAPLGTPVYSAAEGLVVYADDSMRDYGKTVIVLHAGKVSTVYAHLDEILVDEFDQLKRGQILGRVGETGNATGPHLHFELRYGIKPINPEAYLRLSRG